MLPDENEAGMNGGIVLCESQPYSQMYLESFNQSLPHVSTCCKIFYKDFTIVRL